MQVGGWFSPQHPRPSLVFLVRACGREQERLLFTRCLAPTYIPTYLRVDALPVQIDGSQSGVCPSVQRCVGRALARGGWRAGCMACVDYHTHTPHAGTDTSGVGGGGGGSGGRRVKHLSSGGAENVSAAVVSAYGDILLFLPLAVTTAVYLACTCTTEPQLSVPLEFPPPRSHGAFRFLQQQQQQHHPNGCIVVGQTEAPHGT